jgi:hypothetical protein
MSGNAKFRFLLAPIVVALFFVVTSPVSSAGELEDAQEAVRAMPVVQTPKWASNKSQVWRQSITDLSNQLIKNIPPERNPLLGVIPFKDLRYDRITPFSRILNEDIKTILARAEDLKLKEMKINEDQQPGEIAKANGLCPFEEVIDST